MIANAAGLWCAVLAGGTINQGDCVIFQGDTEAVAPFTVVQMTSANSRSKVGAMAGFAGANAVAGNWLWVCRSGNFPAANINTITPTVYTGLHSSAVAGQVTTAVSAGAISPRWRSCSSNSRCKCRPERN